MRHTGARVTMTISVTIMIMFTTTTMAVMLSGRLFHQVQTGRCPLGHPAHQPVNDV